MQTFEHSHVEAMSSCVDACQKCHRACLDAAQHLLEAQPGISGSELFAALSRCIGMTRIAAETVLADTVEHDEACQACAAACLACAGLCQAQPGLGECVKICFECARCCQAAMDSQAA